MEIDTVMGNELKSKTEIIYFHNGMYIESQQSHSHGNHDIKNIFGPQACTKSGTVKIFIISSNVSQ